MALKSKDAWVAEGEASGLIPVDLGGGGVIMTNCKSCATFLDTIARGFDTCLGAAHGQPGKARVHADRFAGLAEALSNVAVFFVSKMAAEGMTPDTVRKLIEDTIRLVGERGKPYDGEEADPTPAPGGWKRVKGES